MALSSNLVSQFAKAITNTETKEAETTVQGKYYKNNNINYVRLNGSNILTPVEMTVGAKDGDDVLVEIKDHRAIVTNNITSPATSSADISGLSERIDTNAAGILNLRNTVGDFSDSSFNTVRTAVDAVDSVLRMYNSQGTYQSTTINAIRSDIETIDSSITTIESDIETIDSNIETLNSDVTTLNSTVTTLDSKVNTFDSRINVNSANITILNSGFVIQDGTLKGLSQIIVDTLDTKYAEIDFANIGEAAIEKLFADTGLINNLVVRESAIVSGELSAVTINGDRINAGTIKADKIYLQDDEDGLYYALNTNAETTGLSQDEYNSLSGSILTRKSVNAEKVSVNDLSAFEATLGGFKLNQDSIYSIPKDSVDSPFDGLYMNDSGELAFGNDDEHIIYSKDDDDNYSLDIKATSGNVYIGDEDNHISFSVNEGKNILDISGTSVMYDSNQSVVSSINTLRTDLNGFETSVQDNYYNKEATSSQIDSKISTFKQTADSIYLGVGSTYTKSEIDDINSGNGDTSVSYVHNETTGLSIDSRGLHVEQSDKDTITNIDAEGLRVTSKSGEELLTVAVEDGSGYVDAKNLHSSNYLIIGSNSRLEDAVFGTEEDPIYATAVYWIR